MLYHISTSHELHTADGHIVVLSYKERETESLREARHVYTAWTVDRMVQAGDIGKEFASNDPDWVYASWSAVRDGIQYSTALYEKERA